MGDWESYIDHRLIRKENGYVVIVPNDDNTERDFCCPVCDHTFRDARDLDAYAKSKCCGFCYERWVIGRENRWLSGWRPSREEIAEALKQDMMTVAI